MNHRCACTWVRTRRAVVLAALTLLVVGCGPTFPCRGTLPRTARSQRRPTGPRLHTRGRRPPRHGRHAGEHGVPTRRLHLHRPATHERHQQ